MSRKKRFLNPPACGWWDGSQLKANEAPVPSFISFQDREHNPPPPTAVEIHIGAQSVWRQSRRPLLLYSFLSHSCWANEQSGKRALYSLIHLHKKKREREPQTLTQREGIFILSSSFSSRPWSSMGVVVTSWLLQQQQQLEVGLKASGNCLGTTVI